MTHSERQHESSCAQCDKPLRQVPCQACNARGFTRKWIVFKDECWICSGDGFRLRCPDELSHAIRLTPAAQGIQRAIPLPWHFSHTNL